MEGKNLFWKSVIALCGSKIKDLEYQNYLDFKDIVNNSWIEKEDSASQVMNIYKNVQV